MSDCPDDGSLVEPQLRAQLDNHRARIAVNFSGDPSNRGRIEARRGDGVASSTSHDSTEDAYRTPVALPQSTQRFVNTRGSAQQA